MTEQQSFLNLLFEPGEVTCFTDHATGYKVKPRPDSSDIYFSINALHPSRDLNPSRHWHSPFDPRRSDANVVSFRNFLLEIDSMPLNDQVRYVTDLIPVSSVVYSGSKSNHFVVSLEDPLQNAAEYRQLAQRLHRLVKKADPATKNPSRLSRLPGPVRRETGKKQELLYLGTRISFSELDALLPKVEVHKIAKSGHGQKVLVSTAIVNACTNPDDTMRQYNISSRNAFFYWLHCRCKELEISSEEKQKRVELAYMNLKDKTDFPLSEAHQAARITKGHSQ